MRFIAASIRGAEFVIKKIPVTLLTGFLGSGKTTLLRHMLTSPSWKDTVVLVNERGEVGLDHHLLWSTNEAVLVLENGCICCSVHDDLIGTLEDLFWKRLQRQIPFFSRVVIETTGLAYPGPIIAGLRSHELVAERYVLENVICTVDAVAAEHYLGINREAVEQVVSADSIVITKTDLAREGAVHALKKMLLGINKCAPVQPSSNQLLSTAMPGADLTELNKPAVHHVHHDLNVRTVALHFNRPWDRQSFERALRATLDRHGEKILRIKGIVNVSEEPGPLVIQAVRGEMYPTENLSSLPDEEHRSFIICITSGVGDGAVMEEFISHMDEPT